MMFSSERTVVRVNCDFSRGPETDFAITCAISEMWIRFVSPTFKSEPLLHP